LETCGTEHYEAQGTEHFETHGTERLETHGTEYYEAQGTEHFETHGTERLETHCTEHSESYGTEHFETYATNPKPMPVPVAPQSMKTTKFIPFSSKNEVTKFRAFLLAKAAPVALLRKVKIAANSRHQYFIFQSVILPMTSHNTSVRYVLVERERTAAAV
jgi:hypothetical protein